MPEVSAEDQAWADRVWGEGGWVRHDDCPAAADAKQPYAIHSVGFHGEESNR